METMETLFTKEQYARLPEGFPAQLIEGQLVREAAPLIGHQRVVLHICGVLMKVVEFELIVPSPVDVPIDEINVYQPDVALYREPLANSAHGDAVPRVVFEVLSPSTAARDRDTKLRHYLAAGVEEVWLVDPVAQVIEIHAADGTRVSRGGDPARSARVPRLELIPDRLFTSPD